MMNTRSNGGYAPAALAAIRASLAFLVALTGIALLAPPAAAEHDPDATYTCLAATNVTDTSATLNAGTTDPSVTSATYSLIIELDAIAVQMPVPAPYSLDLTNLTPGTTYGYRVVFNPGGHAQSNETCNFTTSGVAPPPGPYVCLAATNVTGTSATLNAGTTDRRVTSATFTLAVSDTVQTFMPVTTPYLFSLDLTGLTPGTTYRYTVVFNPGENAQSNETCTFTTPGNPPGKPPGNPPGTPPGNPPANPPANPPRLPDTGFEPATGATAGLLLLTIGAVAAAAGRRRKPIFE